MLKCLSRFYLSCVVLVIGSVTSYAAVLEYDSCGKRIPCVLYEGVSHNKDVGFIPSVFKSLLHSGVRKLLLESSKSCLQEVGPEFDYSKDEYQNNVTDYIVKTATYLENGVNNPDFYLNIEIVGFEYIPSHRVQAGMSSGTINVIVNICAYRYDRVYDEDGIEYIVPKMLATRVVKCRSFLFIDKMTWRVHMEDGEECYWDRGYICGFSRIISRIMNNLKMLEEQMLIVFYKGVQRGSLC